MTIQEPVFPPIHFEQREFFVPATESVEDAHKQWNVFAVDAAVACTDRKIQRLVFTSNRKEHVAEVGYLIKDDSNIWLVTAIFEPHGKSTNDPCAIAMLRIRNGVVGTRKPAWLVAQGAVVKAFDFSQPTAHRGTDEEHTTSESLGDSDGS